jgi:hypothetical protein
MERPKGPGLYATIALPRHNRTDVLKQTHKEPRALPVVPDIESTASAIVRRARALGPGPMETIRRHLDAEAAAAEKRLRELERP